MPRAAADHLKRQIAQGSQGIDEVVESLSQVHSEEAKAWKMEDEVKVKLITEKLKRFHEIMNMLCFFLIFFQRFSCFSKDLWRFLGFYVLSHLNCHAKEVFDRGSQRGKGLHNLDIWHNMFWRDTKHKQP